MNKILRIPDQLKDCSPYLDLARNIELNGDIKDDGIVSICLKQKAFLVAVDAMEQYPLSEQHSMNNFIQNLKSMIQDNKSVFNYCNDTAKQIISEYAEHALCACEVHDSIDYYSSPEESSYLYTQTALLYECLDIFGDLRREQIQKLEYCKWRVVSAYFASHNETYPKIEEETPLIYKKSPEEIQYLKQSLYPCSSSLQDQANVPVEYYKEDSYSTMEIEQDYKRQLYNSDSMSSIPNSASTMNIQSQNNSISNSVENSIENGYNTQQQQQQYLVYNIQTGNIDVYNSQIGLTRKEHSLESEVQSPPAIVSKISLLGNIQ
ncbi:hypothetical protein WA158_008501 [Blastocystis sp. Blastoise]